MSRHSLRLRLSVISGIVLAVSLVVTAIGLTELFTRHLERRVGQELDTHVDQLSGSLRYDVSGGLALTAEPADPRFSRVFGGLYWQVMDTTTGRLLRSRSLWDSELDLPSDLLNPGDVHVHDIAGPNGAALLVHEQLIIVKFQSADRRLRISVAIDRGELEALKAGFVRDVVLTLVLLGCLLLAGFGFLIRAGLRPMDGIAESLGAIRSGRTKRLDDNVPREVAPLVDEVNALLQAQDEALVRARDRAADLAHGLKTPLTALTADIKRLRDKGEKAIADDIEELASRMRRHADRELARARIRHSRLISGSDLGEVASGIIRTLGRTPDGEMITISQDIAPGLLIPVDLDDLNEVVGNLMENAVRHAKSVVRLSARHDDDRVCIMVADDGPGLDPQQQEVAASRGGKLDLSASGAGLGLAIVQDILSAYEGELRLDRTDKGGLVATVILPITATQ